MTITLSSSADVIPFVQKFEAWREAWSRQVLADSGAGNAANKVASFVLWHLNRDSRGCFLRYETVAIGTAMSPRHAMRGIQQLINLGHLRRESRAGKSNYYFPISGRGSEQSVTLGGDRLVTPGVTGSSPPGVTGLSPITSYTLTSESNRSNGNGASKDLEGPGRVPPCPSETISPGAKKNGSTVAFRGEVVPALTVEQIERWRKAYPLVSDIMAELQGCDDFYAANPEKLKGREPFWVASAWLKRENAKHNTKVQDDGRWDSF